jgi:polysaccharide transporter, PST family
MKKWNLTTAFPIYIAQGVSIIIPLILAPLIIKKSGIYVFGIYASLLTISQISLIFSEYSFDVIGPRLIAEKRITRNNDNYNDVYLEVLLAKIPLAIFAMIVGLITGQMILGRLLTAVEVLGLIFMILGTASYGSWYLISVDKIWLMAGLLMISRVLAIINILVLIKLKDSLNGSDIFLAYVLPIAVIGSYVTFICVRNNLNGIYIQKSLKHIKEGFGSFLGMSGGAIQNIIAALLIGSVSGPSSLGVYNAIDRIARTFSAMLKPIFQTLYPYMSRLYKEDKANARQVVIKNIKFVIIISVFILIFMVITGKDIIRIIYGSNFKEYALLLNILLIWLFFGVINNFLGIQGLLASGHDIEYTKGIWICVICTVVIGVIFFKMNNYIYWVAGSVAVGEMVAMIYYSIKFISNGK